MRDNSDLIAGIYAAAIEPARWQSVLNGIVKTNPGLSVSIFSFKEAGPSSPSVCAAGYSDDALKVFGAYYHTVNPIAPLLRNRNVVGVYEVEALEAYRRSEYRNEFLLKHDLGGGVIVRASSRRGGFLTVSMDYEFSRVDRVQHHVEELLGGLRPHFANALTLTNVIQDARLSGHSADQIIESVSVPACILDQDLTLVAGNTLVHRSLVNNAGLKIHDGRIRLDSLKAQAFVEDAARRLQAGNYSTVAAPFLMMSRLGRILLRVWPLPNRGDATTTEFEMRELPPPLLCLTLTPLDEARPTDTELIMKLFGLTSAEARLAQAIGSGMELNAYADANAVSRHTVRNQLKAVFGKTGVSRQVELALLMQRLSA